MSKIKIGNKIFPTLIARTMEEHEKGLMFKPWPPPIMCFPYKNADYRKFWMKNTPSPLDIVFCKNNKIVSIHKGEPYSTAMIGPNIPTDFVIELPYGTMKKSGLKIGDSIEMIKSISIVAQKIEQKLSA